MREYLFVLVVAAVVTYVLTPLVRRLAIAGGALTAVRDRDVHAVPTPRLGGAAMMAGFAAALLLASTLPRLSLVSDTDDVRAVLLGGALVCLLGVADDLWGLDAVTKLAGQVLAAVVMAFQGVTMISLPVFGVTVLPAPVLVAITVFVVVVTINAVNFVDGLDGLAAGIVAIAGTAFFTYAYLLSRTYEPNVFSAASLVSAALVGCCLGFLPHNFNPARIFMGDSGSMLLGLLLSAATISLTGNVDPATVQETGLAPAFFPILLPVAVLVVPMLDLVLAIVRRTRAGLRPWHPDAKHLHHQMLALGHSHAAAVLLLYLWTAVVALGAASLAFLSRGTVAVLVGSATILALALTLRGVRSRGRTAA